MCGITGHVGFDDSLPIVASSLKNLEYRGYDSAGIALDDGGLHVHKQEGVIEELELPAKVDADRAIGHTRWSTHGEPSDANAHPHTDCTGRVAVVHNGIIENYDELREELAGRHTFTSDTDTEVVPHLLENEIAEGVGLVTATQRVVDRLTGSFALAVLVDGQDGIVVARQDSPLVVGHGEEGMYVASDVPAFVEHTRRVTFLEDDDVARVTADGMDVYNDGERVERTTTTVEWDAEAAEKGGYDHYMLKEINEQPRALRQALTGRLDALEGEVDLDLSLLPTFLQSLEEIQLVACGTSYHAGLYAEQFFEDHADVRASTTIASEYEFDGGRDPWRTLVVAVTQSGETADTLGALRRADAAGAQTLAVTNTVGSTVTRETDDSVFIRAGPEIGVAATKTFCSQVATLAQIAVYLGRARETLSSEVAADLVADVQRLPGAVQQVLDRSDAVRAVAEAYADSDAFFFIGRRLGHPVALEGALKLKEISYDHAEEFPAGELKHGPLALVTPDTPVLAVLTQGSTPDETLNNVKEVESRGAPVIGASSDDGHEKLLDVRFEVPDAGWMEPLVANVYLQLFAYHVADLKGRPIDKPRNLAKSVTVE
jgi:glucosamine--fructose-6-phosphate aminotransferase (isomerizing)